MPYAWLNVYDSHLRIRTDDGTTTHFDLHLQMTWQTRPSKPSVLQAVRHLLIALAFVHTHLHIRAQWLCETQRNTWKQIVLMFAPVKIKFTCRISSYTFTSSLHPEVIIDWTEFDKYWVEFADPECSIYGFARMTGYMEFNSAIKIGLFFIFVKFDLANLNNYVFFQEHAEEKPIYFSNHFVSSNVAYTIVSSYTWFFILYI